MPKAIQFQIDQRFITYLTDEGRLFRGAIAEAHNDNDEEVFHIYEEKEIYTNSMPKDKDNG